MNDKYYIDIIVRRIERKLRWKRFSTWTDNEYKRLGNLIYKETLIAISAQTLKRLFGKIKYKDDYTPQTATKEALARFLKYDDWDSFVKEQESNKNRLTSILRLKRTAIFKKSLFVIGIPGLVALIAAIIIYTGNNNKPVTLFAEKTIGLTPFTVSFHYDISHVKGDEIYIDFDINEAESNSPGEILDKKRNLINHCFESPGFYNVTISAKGVILASEKIHVISEGWTSYYFNDDNFGERKFVFELQNLIKDTTNDGLLYISPRDVSDQGFNSKTVFYLEHMLYRDFKLSADSCTFEVKYMNSPRMGGISCYDVEFRIIGENGIASVILVQKGCYRWSEITLGEKHLNGKFYDLSALSANLSDWNVIRIKIENRKAEIINGGDLIFSDSYTRLLGRIKGIRFVTKGSGAFDRVSLNDIQGHVIYSDDFGK